jgi:hypothetical protein
MSCDAPPETTFVLSVRTRFWGRTLTAPQSNVKSKPLGTAPALVCRLILCATITRGFYLSDIQVQFPPYLKGKAPQSLR